MKSKKTYKKKNKKKNQYKIKNNAIYVNTKIELKNGKLTEETINRIKKKKKQIQKQIQQHNKKLKGGQRVDSLNCDSLSQIVPSCSTIGAGAFGEVKFIVFQGKDYVVKLNRDCTEEYNKLLRYEHLILEQLNSVPGVVREVQYCPQVPLLVLKKGIKDIKVFLESQGSLIMDNLMCGLQMAYTLSDIHKRGIVHRDIKPNNIMLMEDKPYKTFGLIDYGLSTTTRNTISYNGTPYYMAPEIFNIKFPGLFTDLTTISSLTHYSQDVFSFGILLFVLLLNDITSIRYASLVLNQAAKKYKIDKEKYDTFFPNITYLIDILRTKLPNEIIVKLYNIIRSCIRYQPVNRPTMETVYEQLAETIPIEMVREYFSQQLEETQIVIETEEQKRHILHCYVSSTFF